MTVHPNSLKALEQNRERTQFSGEYAVECQKKSAEIRSLKGEFQAATYKHLMAEVKDPKKRKTLENAGLPTTYLGLLIHNSSFRAGLNGGMFESFCKAAGIIEEEKTSVNVNNVPIIIGGENELK